MDYLFWIICRLFVHYLFKLIVCCRLSVYFLRHGLFEIICWNIFWLFEGYFSLFVDYLSVILAYLRFICQIISGLFEIICGLFERLFPGYLSFLLR